MVRTRARRQDSGCFTLVRTTVLTMVCLVSPALPGEGNPRPERIAPPARIPQVAAPVPQPRGTPVATASLPREVRRAVVADAARRFEVAESAVVLSAAEQVTWSDGSLGCPQPGMMYTQALVPGYRLSATTTAGQMRYHTDSGGRVVVCAQSAPNR